MIIKTFYIDVIIINKARFAILIYLFLVVLIKQIDLPSNRDFIFELKKLNILIFSINMVDYNLI